MKDILDAYVKPECPKKNEFEVRTKELTIELRGKTAEEAQKWVEGVNNNCKQEMRENFVFCSDQANDSIYGSNSCLYSLRFGHLIISKYRPKKENLMVSDRNPFIFKQ